MYSIWDPRQIIIFVKRQINIFGKRQIIFFVQCNDDDDHHHHHLCVHDAIIIMMTIVIIALWCDHHHPYKMYIIQCYQMMMAIILICLPCICSVSWSGETKLEKGWNVFLSCVVRWVWLNISPFSLIFYNLTMMMMMHPNLMDAHCTYI